MFKKISTTRFFFTCILLLALVPAFIVYYPRHNSANAADFGTFARAYYHVLHDFIRPIQSTTLIRGALKGMDTALSHHKIQYSIPTSELANNASENLEIFHQIFKVTAAAVESKINSGDLMTEALHGMFDATDDPYTVYLAPKEYRMLTESMNGGNFGGIGIYIALEKGSKQLIVLEPIDDTPAAKAGLKAGDEILKIDGKATTDIDLDVAQKLIRGPVGSQVKLTVRRHGEKTEKNYSIERALIHVSSVTSRMENGDIAYLRVRSFGEFTGNELETAMSELEQQGAKAYILDLRQNGGGYIDSARSVCSKFLPRGSLVVSVRERSGSPEQEFADGSEHPDYPLVILVNEFSASASEITAGALQDYHRGRLVGTKTFGKGSVQTIIPLQYGGAAKITIAHYLTPKGKDIDKKGITPDVAVPMKTHDFGKKDDIQLQKGLSLIKEELAKSTTETKTNTGI